MFEESDMVNISAQRRTLIMYTSCDSNSIHTPFLEEGCDDRGTSIINVRGCAEFYPPSPPNLQTKTSPVEKKGQGLSSSRPSTAEPQQSLISTWQTKSFYFINFASYNFGISSNTITYKFVIRLDFLTVTIINHDAVTNLISMQL